MLPLIGFYTPSACCHLFRPATRTQVSFMPPYTLNLAGDVEADCVGDAIRARSLAIFDLRTSRPRRLRTVEDCANKDSGISGRVRLFSDVSEIKLVSPERP